MTKLEKPANDVRIHKIGMHAGEVDISDVNTCELCYLAALIDGKGRIKIDGEDLYPLIQVEMKSLLPYELGVKYGGDVTKHYRSGVPHYTWCICEGSLPKDFVERLIRISQTKKHQLERLLEAVELRDSQPPGWEEDMRRIKEEIAQLNKQVPPDIDPITGEEWHCCVRGMQHDM